MQDDGSSRSGMAITGGTAFLAAWGVLFVGLVMPSRGGIVLVLVVLAALVALDVALAVSPRRLAFRRDGDSAVRLGERAQVRLFLENRGERSMRILVRDAWPPSAGATPRRASLSLPGGERRALATQLVPTRRGERRAAAVTVRSYGPLRLAARQATTPVPWAVRVLPAFPSRKHLPGKLARLRDLEGRSVTLLRGAGTEFDSLREYVVGDDVRAIDWRASARRSDVMVRTWRPERDRHLVLVLDTSRSSAARVGGAPRLDACMDAALLLGALASRAGDRVDLLAYDRRVRARVEGASATELLPSLTNAMAPLEAELLEADMRGLVSTLLARVPRRALIVLLTGLETAGLEEGLLPVLPQLLKRHTVLLGAVADPAVAAMARQRGDAAEVYGAAAAELTLRERAAMRERLGRLGVDVVDEVPDQLAPALADRYLARKAAGLL